MYLAAPPRYSLRRYLLFAVGEVVGNLAPLYLRVVMVGSVTAVLNLDTPVAFLTRSSCTQPIVVAFQGPGKFPSSGHVTSTFASGQVMSARRPRKVIVANRQPDPLAQRCESLPLPILEEA
jgi:hypothetical protein